MNTQIRPALTLFAVLSLLTGLAYPLLVTGIAQVAFPHQANGSLILRDGKSGRFGHSSARASPIRSGSGADPRPPALIPTTRPPPAAPIWARSTPP